MGILYMILYCDIMTSNSSNRAWKSENSQRKVSRLLSIKTNCPSVWSTSGLSDVLPNMKPYVPRIGKVGTLAPNPSNLLIFCHMTYLSVVRGNWWFASSESQSWWGNRSVWRTLLNPCKLKTRARWGQAHCIKHIHSGLYSV